MPILKPEEQRMSSINQRLHDMEANLKQMGDQFTQLRANATNETTLKDLQKLAEETAQSLETIADFNSSIKQQ